MRCPDCGNFLGWSFVDDFRHKEPVYQCRTVGVEIMRVLADGKVVRGMSLDHSDEFFAVREGLLVRVVPVKIDKDSWTTRVYVKEAA